MQDRGMSFVEWRARRVRMPRRRGRSTKQWILPVHRRENESTHVSGDEVACEEKAVDSPKMHERSKRPSTSGTRKEKGAMMNPLTKKRKTAEAATEEARWRAKYVDMQHGFKSVDFSWHLCKKN